MKINEMISVVKELAKTQGFYSRILASWIEYQNYYPAMWDDIVNELESLNFKDSVEFCMYLECYVI